MDEHSVRPIRPESKALTLADIRVTWEHYHGGVNMTRTITGRQLARLITIAAEQTGNDDMLASGSADEWIYQLRGLSVLLFPDAGVSVHEGDGRATLSNILAQASAELAAEALDTEDRPAAFKVERIKPEAEGDAA